MKKWIKILICLSLTAGCGTKDYAKRPEDVEAAPKTKTTVPPPSQRVPLAGPSKPARGHLWGGFEWIGLSPAYVESLRCSHGDRGGARSFDSFGAALVGGAVIGVVVRFSGSFFFGRPAGDGHNSHGGPDLGPSSGGGLHAKSFWKRFYAASDHLIGAGLSGAVFVGGCQALLAGADVPPFDGLLGRDFSALSSAIAIGGASSVAFSPWVWKAFGEAPPRSEAVSPPKPPPPPVEGQTTLDFGDGPLPLPKGRWARTKEQFTRLRNWSNESGFTNGFWYKLMPGAVILGISNTVGLIVYNQIYDEALARENGYPLPSHCEDIPKQ